MLMKAFFRGEVAANESKERRDSEGGGGNDVSHWGFYQLFEMDRAKVYM